MTPEIFKENHSKVKELIDGHGRSIAAAAGMSYTAYFNCIRGLVTKPEKLEKVWEAMKAKAEELTAKVEEL